ncbi:MULTISPECIES: type II secretion system protein [Sphingomonas]|jgi:prepilin-type N-terminal cleavage/methylation domain-containing protein|uniref:type II secretion system protein n=1 Tax=Sphingomonas TaxID=13687 RepID=UPI002FEF1C93
MIRRIRVYIYPAKPGFSLIELSIVLVILGLLTGGILAGQSLIRAAELRSVGEEYQKNRTAVATFRDKYFAIPGDMTNATSFWGLAGGTAAPSDAACGVIVSTDQKTCNGDGSGKIDAAYEAVRFWQQLANAGLIEGQYTGAWGTTAPTLIQPGVNMPRAKVDSAAFWQPQYEGPASGNPGRFDNRGYGNVLFITDWRSTWTANFTPAEAWNIDKKFDDGVPYSGIVVSGWGTDESTVACTTATSSADFTATYNFSASGKDCWLGFIKAF